MHKPKVWHELQSLLQSQTLIEPFFLTSHPVKSAYMARQGTDLVPESH